MFKTFVLLKIVLFVFVASFVSGCASPSVINYAYKANVTVETKDADRFECKVESTQEVPANYRTSSSSGYTTPVSCNTNYSGGVDCTGGQTVGGGTKTVDVNSGLRDDYFGRCMAKKGYKNIKAQISECKKHQIPAGIPNKDAKIHAPVEGACWIDGAKYARMIVLPSEQP